MARKGLIVVLLAVVLGLVPLALTACGESKAVAQPTFSPNVVPRLVQLGPFALISGQPTHVMIHATKSHPLRIVMFADRKLDSIALYRVARPDGSLVRQVALPLHGTPHTQSHTTAYGLTTGSIQPGFYRLDLHGRGRVWWLVVMDW